MEADIDVGSSKIATLVKGVFFKGASSIVTDLAFTLEGQADDELPERIMACLRFHNTEFDQVAVDKSAIL